MQMDESIHYCINMYVILIQNKMSLNNNQGNLFSSFSGCSSLSLTPVSGSTVVIIHLKIMIKALNILTGLFHSKI